MRYTIGETAALLGVTAHMLRHYEKMGILRPEVNAETGYRYYSGADTRRFNYCRTLLSMGFSLPECRQIMDGEKSDRQQGLVDEKLRDLDRQIYLLTEKRVRLERLRRSYDGFEARLGIPEITHSDELWRLSVSHGEKPILSEALLKEKKYWLQWIPMVSWASRIPGDSLRQGGSSFSYDYGLVVAAAKAPEIGIRRTKNVELIPGGDYASLLWAQDEGSAGSWPAVHVLLDWMKAKGIRIYGDAIVSTVASFSPQETTNYHVIRIKILG